VGAAEPRDIARPRIRRRLRLIAAGLVLLPTVAVALLVKTALDADAQARERELEARRARALGRTTDLARALADREVLFPAEATDHYRLLEAVPARPLVGPIDIDGGCSDWRAAGSFEPDPCGAPAVAFARREQLTPPMAAYDPDDFSFALMTGEREGYLYLFARVRDDELVYRGRRLDDGDHLRLVFAVAHAPPARFVVTLERGSEGAVTTYQVERGYDREVAARDRLAWGDYQSPVTRRPYGAWRPTREGYDLELRLPLRTLGPRWREAELGLAVVDVDRGVGSEGRERHAIWALPQREGALALRSPDAPRFERAARAVDLDLAGRNLAVFDVRGRELFSSFVASESTAGALRPEAIELLDALERNDTETRLYPGGVLAGARITSPGGERLGFVLEQDSTPDPPRRLAAVLRESPLSAAILAGAFLLLFGLLVYTRRLSRRILALIDDVGAERAADDEIGELSRRLSELVERVRADRDYLERLPGILGHETLGPLGVVKMFIDDLEERAGDGGPRRQAARRAIHSVEELIEDLREATSLEEALARGERVEVELVEFLRSYTAAYAEASGATLQVVLPAERVRASLIEGRIEQLLDKLLDNAVEFSDGESVRLSAETEGGRVRIRVENRGPHLPDGSAAERIFEPMWSDRKRTAERHLGMGLYVARVIAEHHGGRIRAWNAPGARVIFEVTLPADRAA
jgi:two-component system sensor histidine kinase ChvG